MYGSTSTYNFSKLYPRIIKMLNSVKLASTHLINNQEQYTFLILSLLDTNYAYLNKIIKIYNILCSYFQCLTLFKNVKRKVFKFAFFIVIILRKTNYLIGNTILLNIFITNNGIQHPGANNKYRFATINNGGQITQNLSFNLPTATTRYVRSLSCRFQWS